MKNLLLLLLAATFFISCKKDSTSYIATDPVTKGLDNATVSGSGKLVFSDEGNSQGWVKIYLKKDGTYVLGLEQMNYQSLFDTNIYLSAGAGLTTTSVKIFSAKKLQGNIYYPLPAGINLAAIRYLIIQSDKDDSPTASAALQ